MVKVDASGFLDAMKGVTERLGVALGESGLRATGFAGAEIFREQAKLNALASKKTGVLYNNIIVKRLEEEGSDTKQSYLVTVRTGKFGNEGDAYYWKWVENGHSFVRRGKSKKDTLKKRRVEALEFGTSTAPAYPFMRPAFESQKEEATVAMNAKITEIVNGKLSEP